MKRLTFILLLLLANCFSGQAQGGRKLEMLEAARVGFITKQIGLTSQEAEKFWPIFNRFDAEKRALRKRFQAEHLQARAKFETMSDKEVEELIENSLKFRQSEVELERKAVVEYKKILPIKKIALLMKAEKDFQKEILKNLRKRRFEEE